MDCNSANPGHTAEAATKNEPRLLQLMSCHGEGEPLNTHPD